VVAQDLAKSFGETAAVDGVSFEVNEGEIFGILGRNGAGKTTTIEMVAGLLRPDRGRVTILGTDMVAKRTLGQRQIGYVPQDNVVYPALTPRENLAFALGLRGLSRREGLARTDHLLDVLGLQHVADRRAAKLSGGERRRTSIAMGLVHQPPVMILDEATAAVDVETRRDILTWLQSLRSEGVTTIYTTHYLEEAEQLCDRVLILHGGRTVVCDRIDNLLRTYGTGMVTVRGDFGDRGGVADAVEKAVPGSETRVIDGSLVVRVADPQGSLLAILGSIGEKGVVEGVEVSVPTLEGAFLTATGERYEPDGAVDG
jgi:ABC-type multidrug transport system ATPase subunit